MAHSTDYDVDILEWSERQASALRELGRRRPELSNELDWEHVAEEIEDVGRSEFNTVQSLLRQILVHLIKALSAPHSEATLHWQGEVLGFHADMLDRLSPSMGSRIDLEKLWRRAINQAEAELAVHAQEVEPALRSGCPLELDDLLDPNFDFLPTVERMRRAPS